MNIILLGYRGSGKTTLGRLLADQLWKTFVDTDAQARATFGDLTIAQIWERLGEPAWRAAEVEVTRQVCAADEQVIALGGGVLMEPAARLAVQQAPHAVRIYLHCEPAVLAARIAADAQTTDARPNLTDQGGGVEEIKTVLAQREPVYRAVADKVFDVTHVNPKEAAAFLIQRCL